MRLLRPMPRAGSFVSCSHSAMIILASFLELTRHMLPIDLTDGPDGIQNGTIGGYPKELQPNPLALDPENTKRFFEACEQMTGTKYSI